MLFGCFGYLKKKEKKNHQIFINIFWINIVKIILLLKPVFSSKTFLVLLLS